MRRTGTGSIAASISRSCSACRASWSSCRTGCSTTSCKVVVIFEGRDAAGKGGVIKRITQRLNPAHLPRRGAAGAERARADAVVFPALRRAPAGRRRDRAVRPQLVQPRRRRAGDGLLHRRRVEEFFRSVPEFERMLVRSGHHADQVLVLDHRRGAAVPLHDAHPRSAQAVEAEPDGRGVARAAGSTTPRPRKRCWSARTSPRRRGGSSRRSTRSGRGSTASATCSTQIPYQEVAARAGRAAAARAQSRLPPRPGPEGDVRPGEVLSAIRKSGHRFFRKDHARMKQF